MHHKLLVTGLSTLFALLLIFQPSKLVAVPATPHPVVRTLPDGSQITVLLRGDEYFKYELTTDGYLIRETDQGFYEYARMLPEGGFMPTGIRANNPERRTGDERRLITTLQPYPDMTLLNVQRRIAKSAEQKDETAASKVFPRTGSPKSIVILVNFSDVAYVTPNAKNAFTNLLNEPGYSANGGTGSARDYFKTASFGVSSPEFVVVGPYTLPNTRSFYGENNTDGDDKNPRQMVVDACKAANADGVNFSVYDTDLDGVVDNVFIYYAGHNEAEGGPKETVWPHRWGLSTPLSLNNVLISGYACTSELRGSSGSNMCGIGTFAHEFGHVYGLPDYYATNGASHHTLSNWNIMDGGAYLNSGRTPPTYSVYDRFQIGWITPTLLKSPLDVTLTELQSTNKGYIITQSGNHNMSGSSPSPTEFFTLENRQKTGWDTYLPNSGMLITRINYNSTTWRNNGPNNDALLMGVDIIEADGIASNSSLAGDVFPGTRDIRSYSPVSRSGVSYEQPITEIQMVNGLISFRFMGGGNRPKILTDAEKTTPFKTIHGTPSAISTFGLSGTKMKGNVTIDFTEKKHFEVKLANDPGTVWSKSLIVPIAGSILDSVQIQIRYNPAEPSHKEIHYDYLNINSEDADLIQIVVSGQSARPVYVVPPVASAPASAGLTGYDARWNSVFDASGYYLTAWNTTAGTTELKEGFDEGLKAPQGWTINAESVVTLATFAGDSVPAIQLKETDDFIQTDFFVIPATRLSFFVRSIGEMNGTVRVEGLTTDKTIILDEFNVNSSLNSVKNYNFPESDGIQQFKIVFIKGNASVSIDDVTIGFSKALEFNTYNQWVVGNTAFVDLLVPGRDYFYAVRASDKTLNSDKSIKYENITVYSNYVNVQVNETIWKQNSKSTKLSLYTEPGGFAVLKIDALSDALSPLLYIYQTDGRLLSIMPVTNDQIPLDFLKRGKAYVLKYGDSAIRVVL
jgi:M6 family metalloprotease-like protein